MPEPGWDAERYAAAFSFVPERGRELLAWLGPQPGERIIDLGCGTGALTAAIAEAGADAQGVDLDAAMLALARREHPGIAFRRADASRRRSTRSSPTRPCTGCPTRTA